MKVLGIVGSPRKGGNTDLLVSEVLRSARDAGAQTETVYLGDLDIRCCDGCYVCRSTSECVQSDDMIGMYRKLFESDVWVLGTPVYWWGPTGLMKCFIDRWYFFAGPNERWQVKGKRMALVCVFADSDPDTAWPIVRMIRKSADYLEMPLVGELLVTAGAKGQVASNEKAMSDARDLGRLVAQRAKIEG